MKFKKIYIQTSKKLYNQGKEFYILPNKIFPSFDNPWIKPLLIDSKEYLENGYSFESFLNNYSYYNLNDKETGLKPSFYIEEE